MTSLATVECPHCAADLVIEGVRADQRLLCAGCRRSFQLEAGGRAVVSASQRTAAAGTRAAPLPYSRAANAARWLGFLSFLPLIGLAAFTAGLLGVRDLRRHPGRRGLGRAVFGLVAGGLTTLGWLLVGLVVGMSIYFAQTLLPTTDPVKIAAIAAAMGPFTMPPGLEPLRGEDVHLAGIRVVLYGKRSSPPATGVSAPFAVQLVLLQMPRQAFTDRRSMENMLHNKLEYRPWLVPEETKQVTYTIRGQPVAVTRTLGKERGSGQRWREYVAMVFSEQHRLGVLLLTAETDGLSEEEVRQFFESFP
jgi:hypothetical protein